jgi:hypothetical protein
MMISLDKTYRQIIIQKSHRHEVKSLILVNSVRKEVSHLDLRGKVGCVSYVRQGRTTHNNRVHRNKCHKYHKCTYYIAEVLQNK